MAEDKKKHIVVISDGWGPKFGGINSFNTDFCKALGDIISQDYSVICAVPRADQIDRIDASNHNVTLLEIDKPLVDHVANHIKNLIHKEYKGEIIWWIGHDVYSGDIANYGREFIGGQSAVFQHMAYWDYSTLKNKDGNRTAAQDKKQREIAENCDLIFGVGPLLADHAKKFKDSSKVFEIIPGLQSIEKRHRSDGQFNGIIFGRMNKEDDIIKQGKLGAKAFGKFSGEIKSNLDNITPNLTVIGLPNHENEYADEYDELKNIINVAAEQQINVVPLSYTDNRRELFRKLAEHHVCLMLSWHEGFGLVGWEAIAAEVPLVISKNSGLFRLLDERHRELTALLHPVSIKNNKDDVDEVVKHLRKIERDRKKVFQWAEKLKNSLIDKGYTWQNAARAFAVICDIPVIQHTPELAPERVTEPIPNIPSKPKHYKTFQSYLNSALVEHRHLPTQGFETKVRIAIELERIYINMHAVIQGCEFDYSVKGKKLLREKIRQEKLSALDIKDTFAAASKHNIKDIVILGDPGSGKTTLLKYILIMLIQGRGEEKLGIDTRLVPFFVPLRELKAPDREEFLDFIKRVCRLDKFAIQGKDLKVALENGRSIVLLDGLDEVADENTRIKVCKWIDEARIRFAMTRFVITSRFAGYLGKSRLEGNCLELSIQDFTEQEVKTFLIQWFESVETILHASEDDTLWKERGREEALALFKRISESEHIKKLAVTPLLLQIIALVHRDRGTLPQRRVELYEECTNVLLEKWDMAKGLDVLISAREARQVLQPLALWLHAEDERRSAPMEQIIEVIKDPLQEIGKSDVNMKKLLLNIRDRSGIFMGYSETEYGFTHLSFQEYLAAEQIRNAFKIDLLREKYGQKWWKEVILLCLALNNPSVLSDFMCRIIPTENFKTDITLVMVALGDSIVKPARPFTDALDNMDLSLDARLNCIRALKRIGGPKAIQALKVTCENKENPSALIRAAYEALESMGQTEGIRKPQEDLTPTTLASSIDEAPMVLVPAGQFLYGSREDDKVAGSNEKPQKVIDLPVFYIDQYPVTNERYCRFLNDAAPDENTLGKWIYLKGSFDKERCRIKLQGEKFQIEKGYENHPVIFVTWFGAKGYAKWAEKRLPTEQEWEKAARGTEGAVYPWGNEFDKNLCNSWETRIRGTTPIDRFPKGKSPFGCFDMAGNVWEWTDSWYDKEKKRRVIRGGSWYDGSDYCRCACRYGDDPYGRGFDMGFRCARI